MTLLLNLYIIDLDLQKAIVMLYLEKMEFQYLSTVNHNDSINKIYAITGISLENSVYYIYIFYKHYISGELIFAPSDFDCIVWYIPN